MIEIHARFLLPQSFFCSSLLILVHDTSDLSKHLQTVAVHDGNTSKGCTLLEGLNEKWLGRLEDNFGRLVLRKFRGVLNLGTSSLLTLLPQNLGHLAGNLGGTAENDRTVTRLQDTRMLLDSDNGREGVNGLQFTLLLNVDDITRLDLLVLSNTLDGHTNRVTGSGRIQNLLVLFNGENLLSLQVARDHSNDITRTDGSLFDGTTDNLTNSLNVVNVGDGKTDRSIGKTLGGLNKVVKALNKSKASDLDLGLKVGLPALVPGSLVRLLGQVVSVEPTVGDERDLLGLESNQLKHLDKLRLDFFETTLVPVAGVHLVDTDNNLFDTKQVQKTSMLTGLSLFNSQLGVGLGNGSFETTLLGRDQQKTNIGRGRSGNHILDVILVAWGIDNSVVVLVGEELLGVALNGDTTFTFFLAGIQVVSKSERRLSLLLGHALKLFHLTSRNTALLENQMTACGRFSCCSE
mmetsp:Transcript_33830/g.50158  ORF Transcript_33830/g.50158 Transcript_33830/m.50158 type:complete len:462 (-) Transcript_33830:202-1587(-)